MAVGRTADAADRMDSDLSSARQLARGVEENLTQPQPIFFGGRADKKVVFGLEAPFHGSFQGQGLEHDRDDGG